jgi:transcriptional regulator with XRE-family HTH domain
LSYVSKLELGGVEPCLDAFTKIAKGLEVSPGVLLGEEPRALSREALAFGRVFDLAPAAMQEQVLSILRTFKSPQ